eukprot:TRINITY_DN4070_c0_g1_i2.p1 TRINITY_DN4070_c0_g1~~TRINITY_DN4070_c0_g1_i2.p1  ORF type:complete len:442 (+),score=84.97 TRINITY_DN4070_c0_g1_i2:301-1626(+)
MFEIMCVFHKFITYSILTSTQELTGAHTLFAIQITDNGTSVTASLWPLMSRKAVYYGKNCGCTLLPYTILPAIVPPHPYCTEVSTSSYVSQKYWPYSDTLDPHALTKHNIDVAQLSKVIDSQFPLESAATNEDSVKTYGIGIIYKGDFIYEKYGRNTTSSTPLAGWSVTKSLTSTLAGIRVLQGKMSLDDPVSLHSNTNTTIARAIEMNTEIEWEEYYTSESDVTKMLLINGDTFGYIKQKITNSKNGSNEHAWKYNSGNTNLVTGALRESFGNISDYWGFPRKYLFDPLGMKSAVIEMDNAGTFVGSSYAFATLRDWARYGLLYRNDGVWVDEDGKVERILPEGWVEYSRTPASGSRGFYGAGFWVSGRTFESDFDKEKWGWHVVLPEGSFYAHGFEQQTILIVPSLDLVVVRFGVTKVGSNWNHQAFYGDLIKCFSPKL